MPPDPIEPGSPADWLRHARSDLAYASAPLPPEGLLEGLCFHAQQAAEKAIKAVLVSQGTTVPRTHNLKTLLEQVRPPVRVPAKVLDAVVLTDYAVQYRYPGDLEPLQDTEYRQAIAHARQVMDWAQRVVAEREEARRPRRR
jgi:HEPN domain-containing protein